MHEFALASSIRHIALETAKAHSAVRVREVRCRIGAMRQVVPLMLHTAFEACCTGTIAGGAKLIIEIDPVSVTCSSCGSVSRSETMPYQCPRCNSVEISLEGGTAMQVVSINIDEENDDGNHGSAERARA